MAIFTLILPTRGLCWVASYKEEAQVRAINISQCKYLPKLRSDLSDVLLEIPSAGGPCEGIQVAQFIQERKLPALRTSKGGEQNGGRGVGLDHRIGQGRRFGNPQRLALKLQHPCTGQSASNVHIQAKAVPGAEAQTNWRGGSGHGTC